MKYVCKICGYVYDDEKEKVAFSSLPDSWVCPMCGARKSDFEPQGETKRPQKSAKQNVAIDDDMKKLSNAQLSVLCSNLARGCEKQYRQRESDLFKKLADYFMKNVPALPENDVADISKLLNDDLADRYLNLNEVGQEEKDRGALRVCVWGDKVTRILKGLLERYETEGEDFLKGTEIWVCSICGFVYIGETPPKLCPVCKVPDWKFDKIEGRKSV